MEQGNAIACKDYLMPFSCIHTASLTVAFPSQSIQHPIQARVASCRMAISLLMAHHGLHPRRSLRSATTSQAGVPQQLKST